MIAHQVGAYSCPGCGQSTKTCEGSVDPPVSGDLGLCRTCGEISIYEEPQGFRGLTWVETFDLFMGPEGDLLAEFQDKIKRGARPEIPILEV